MLVPIALVMLTPPVWVIVTSIETVAETRRFPPVIVPSGIHWQNYQTALTDAPMARWFMNTMIVTVVSVIGNLVFCSSCGGSTRSGSSRSDP